MPIATITNVEEFSGVIGLGLQGLVRNQGVQHFRPFLRNSRRFSDVMRRLQAATPAKANDRLDAVWEQAYAAIALIESGTFEDVGALTGLGSIPYEMASAMNNVQVVIGSSFAESAWAFSNLTLPGPGPLCELVTIPVLANAHHTGRNSVFDLDIGTDVLTLPIQGMKSSSLTGAAVIFDKLVFTWDKGGTGSGDEYTVENGDAAVAGILNGGIAIDLNALDSLNVEASDKVIDATLHGKLIALDKVYSFTMAIADVTAS
jgi:hypothetical protein